MESFEFLCSICGKPTATERGLKIHMTRVHGNPDEANDPDPVPLVDVPGLYEDGAGGEMPPIAPFGEEPPDPPKTWREKIWGSATDAVKSKPAVQRPRKRRQSTEGIWQATWTVAGMALVRTGADIPVGNCLQFQAPVVGDILDEAIAGTFLDTLMQPIAGQGKRMKKVSSVLAMPILVGAMERSPAAAPILEPLLRQTIIEHLVAMAPVIKARQKQEEQLKKAVAEMGIDATEDAVEAVLEAIFPRMGAAPEMNGRGKVGADV